METAIFIGLVILAILVFDVYIIAKKGRYHSVSAFLIRASYEWPMIPFLMGYVCGHLFWKMSTLSVYGCESNEVIDIIKACVEVNK